MIDHDFESYLEDASKKPKGACTGWVPPTCTRLIHSSGLREFWEPTVIKFSKFTMPAFVRTVPLPYESTIMELLDVQQKHGPVTKDQLVQGVIAIAQSAGFVAPTAYEVADSVEKLLAYGDLVYNTSLNIRRGPPKAYQNDIRKILADVVLDRESNEPT